MIKILLGVALAGVALLLALGSSQIADATRALGAGSAALLVGFAGLSRRSRWRRSFRGLPIL